MTSISETFKLSDVPSFEAIESAAQQRIQRRQETGRRLVEIAQNLKEAQTQVEVLTRQYADAYSDATTDAWSAAELSENGLPDPASRSVPKRRQRRTSATAKSTSSKSEANQ